MNIPTATTSHGEASVTMEAIRGMRASIPVMLGFVPFALVLGAQAAQNGLSVFEVPLMTGMNFGGGSEFAAMRLWTSPPQVLLIVAMSFLVNSRHLLMGAAFVPYLLHLPRRTVIPALFLMCDESWAMALNDAQKRSAQTISFHFYLGVSACLYLTWVVFTGLGAAIGPMIGDLEQYGFDMAFTAVFLVLLKGMWKGANRCLPWLGSLLVAALTYLFIPGAWYVASGAVSGLAVAAIRGKLQ